MEEPEEPAEYYIRQLIHFQVLVSLSVLAVVVEWAEMAQEAQEVHLLLIVKPHKVADMEQDMEEILLEELVALVAELDTQVAQDPQVQDNNLPLDNSQDTVTTVAQVAIPLQAAEELVKMPSQEHKAVKEFHTQLILLQLHQQLIILVAAVADLVAVPVDKAAEITDNPEEITKAEAEVLMAQVLVEQVREDNLDTALLKKLHFLGVLQEYGDLKKSMT